MGALDVRILLDTHAAIWAGEGDERFGAEGARALGECKLGDAFIADVTLLEVSMLAKGGRLQLQVEVEDYLRRLARNFPPIPIDAAIAAEAMRVELAGGDMFARLIVATAIIHDLTLITRDANIRDSGLVRAVW